MSDDVTRYWLEAGTILYLEKQPDKPFIPRRGESLVSQAVYREADYAALQQQRDAMRTLLSRIEGHLADVGNVSTEAEVGVLQLKQQLEHFQAKLAAVNTECEQYCRLLHALAGDEPECAVCHGPCQGH